ncbi:hypothetical protein [Methylocucumis oryzae]|uniref:hypothetical protein n=1 Tax=Methylocucumis oryzae TaxID=1632867 RepID=UPI00069780CF|nr:hypothetical protein [Methylocucumis oryzae]
MLRWPMPIWLITAIQAGCAVTVASLLKQPVWWRFIHALFVPLLLFSYWLNLPSSVYLSLFSIGMLVYWGTIQGEVPLFLSSLATARAVAELISKEDCRHFAELGAGTGSLLPTLTQQNPTLSITAFEHAPLPWLICYWRSRRLSAIKVLYQNFWQADLAEFDVVFAFLSPAVMPALARKLKNEMRSGSLLISSSFAVPDWQAERIVNLSNRKDECIYCYRL